MYYSFHINIQQVIKPEPRASVHVYGTEQRTSALRGDIPRYRPLVLESQPPPCLRLVVYFFSGDLVSCKAIDTAPLHSWKSALWLRSLLTISQCPPQILSLQNVINKEILFFFLEIMIMHHKSIGPFWRCGLGHGHNVLR
jgi:hypothetical protein